MFFDPLYLVFVVPALLLALYAQWRVKSWYGRYTRQANMRGLTGLDAANAILRPEGLNDVSIKGTPGELTDHYDPRDKSLNLSQGVARQPERRSPGDCGA